MAKFQSALGGVYRACQIGVQGGSAAVTIGERRERQLLQISGWRQSFSSLCSELEAMLSCEMPQDYRHAKSTGDRSVFRTGPERLLIAGPSSDAELQHLDCKTLGHGAVVTDVGHSRTVLRIAGPEANTLLSRGLPIDVDPEVFPPNAFAQSAIHHIPTLVHRVDMIDSVTFDIYVSRDLTVSFWEWLVEAATPLGCEIIQPDNSAYVLR